MDLNLYTEHLAFMYSLDGFDSVSDEDFINAFKSLLKCLPNHGKIYKYRSSNDDSFQFTFDSLKKNYIWLSNANDFNDGLDATIDLDYEECSKRIIKYLMNNKNVVFNAFLKYERENPNKKFITMSYFHNDVVATAVNFMDEDGNIDRFGLKQALIKKVDNYDDTVLDDVIVVANQALLDLSNQYYKYLTSNGINILKKINDYRNDLRIFCMCERYDLDNMWAYYSKNKGFVIEYDFNSLLNQDISIIKKCISMYKVNYTDEYEQYNLYESFVDTLGGKERDHYSSGKDIINQLTRKNSCWSNEKEWRIILANVDNRLGADLVSAVYIDSSFLEDDKAKQLIELANERGWNIYTRKLNAKERKYDYALINY